MGVSVREKEKGSRVWWVFIIQNNRKRSRKIGNKRLAEQVAQKLKARLILGDTSLLEKPEPEPQMLLFRDYALLWLEDYIKELCRQSTYERYRSISEKYIFPVIGKKPIDKIKRGDIKNLLLKHYKEGHSRSSVCLCRDVLSGVMGHAVDEEEIAVNPVIGVIKKLKLDREKKIDIEPMTQKEVKKILETCAEELPEHYPFFLCAFRTGMRLGELAGLRWDDIDWKNKRIRVERTCKNGHVSPTKNGKARLVDMSNHLQKTLQGLLKEKTGASQGNGEGGTAKTIFMRSGRSLHQNSVRGTWKRLLKKSGVHYRRFHDIRHTYASLLLTQGESPVYVKEQLGHSSIQITVDIYGHWVPSSNREAVNQLDKEGN